MSTEEPPISLLLITGMLVPSPPMMDTWFQTTRQPLISKIKFISYCKWPHPNNNTKVKGVSLNFIQSLRVFLLSKDLLISFICNKVLPRMKRRVWCNFSLKLNNSSLDGLGLSFRSTIFPLHDIGKLFHYAFKLCEISKQELKVPLKGPKETEKRKRWRTLL